MNENLKRSRPPGWSEGSLTSFIENSWGNALGSFNNNPDLARKLQLVDSAFEALGPNLNEPKHLVPTLLFIRAVSAYRLSAGLSMAAPTESYSLMRSCLENAGYSQICADTPSFEEVWLRRHESEANRRQVRKAFVLANMIKAICKYDPRIAVNFSELYERAIDFGAHPLEKGVTSTMKIENIAAERILEVSMLPDSEVTIQHAMRTCAQVGVCVMEVFCLIFADRVKWLGIPAILAEAKQGL